MARSLAVWSALAFTALAAQSTGATRAAILAALRTGQNQQALQLCEQSLHRDREDAQAWILRGLALSRLHHPKQSLQSFQRALHLRPDSLPALEGAAQVAYQSGDAQAEPLLRRLVRSQPDNPTAHAMLATLAFQQGDCQQALAHFQRSGSALQQDPSSLAQFGDCLIRNGQSQPAVLVFQRWLALQPDSHAARFDLGLSQYLDHQDQQAVTTLTPLLQANQRANASSPAGNRDRVNALNLLAAAEEANHQTGSAVAHLHAAIELAPRDPRNYLDLATISLVHRSYQVGIDVLNAGLRALPGNASLAVARGVLYAQMGHFEQAEADFQQAESTGRAVEAQRSAATVGMGIALMQTDHIDGAIALLHQKLAREPENPDLNFLLAIALQRKGMTPGGTVFQQAESALQKALRKRPRFAAARDELSALELRHKKPEKAAEDARLAMQLDPQNPSPVYHRMMALRQLGQTAEAARLARQLAQLQTDAQKRELTIDRVRLVTSPDQHE